jgi:hypothetical protein
MLFSGRAVRQNSMLSVGICEKEKDRVQKEIKPQSKKGNSFLNLLFVVSFQFDPSLFCSSSHPA